MAFQFDSDDASVQAGFRRIARERFESALALAQGAPDAEAVHALRKDIKKLRGLLRLVRPRFRDYGRANATLRKAATQLSELRDAEVMLATLDKLIPALESAVEPAPIRAKLEADVARLRDPGALASATVRLGQALEGMRDDAADWRVKGREFSALEEGLAETWRTAQRGLKAARRSSKGDFDAAPFHTWRSSVKHHWYQARLLQPIWPEMMATHIAAADALGELLGDHNDLDVLAGPLARDFSGALSEPAGALIDAALLRRQALAGQAIELGRRFLAEPADALCARWGQWWALWRG